MPPSTTEPTTEHAVDSATTTCTHAVCAASRACLVDVPGGTCARCGRAHRTDLSGPLCHDCRSRGFTTAPRNPHLVKVTSATATQRREERSELERVTEIRDPQGGRNLIRSGDVVFVAPSRPGRRDGFEATFKFAKVVNGHVEYCEVYGGPIGRASMRSIRPERIRRRSQAKTRRAVS